MRFPRLTLVAASATLVVLSGCAGQAGAPVETTAPPVAETPPSATPEPSASAEPEPEPLVISTAGLDAVKLDAPVPDDLAIATWDPDYCAETNGPGAFAPEGATAGDEAEYVIRTKDFDQTSDVTSVIVYSEDIVTPSGVHVGMSRSEVKDILPQMKRYGDKDDDLASLYVVEDDLGQLVFEFAEGNMLKDIKAVTNDQEPYGIWFTDGGGRCPA